jgi:peptidoglycan/LPS O-acetylase OafA/YrhL
MRATSRNFGLDVMRATAILLVVFAHYFASTPLMAAGLPGVEIFFVLSGFLIGDILVRSLQEKGVTIETYRTFLLKRWFRTLPNYAAFLLFHLAFVLLTTSHFPVNWYYYFIFGQNVFGPMPGFFKESWSLAIEEWFYLLFPLLIVVINRGVQLRHKAVFAVIGCFLVVPLLLRVYASAFWDLQTIRMIVPLRLDTIMYGVIAAVIMNWRPELWSRLTGALLLAPALALFLAGIILVEYESRFSSVVSFPLIAMGAALATPFLQGLPRTGVFFPALIEYISKVSYSTYLLNIPFFFFADGLIAWGHAPMIVKFFGRIVMIIALLIVSYLPYKCIETPFLRMRQRVLKK